MTGDVNEELKIGAFCRDGTLATQNGFACGDWNDEAKGILQLRPFNITNLGQIDLSATKYVETDRNIGAYLLQNRDVIFNNTNSEELVGKAALWARTERAVLSNHMTILRVLRPDKLNSEFLSFYLLKLWFDRYFHSVCRRHVNQASVSTERLRDTGFPNFNVSTQRKIAALLALVQRAIEQQERLLMLTAELKSALLHQLFTHGLRHENQQHTEIGSFPESWVLRTIGDLDLDIGDGNYSTKYPKKEAFLTAGVPFLRANNVVDGRLSWNDMRYISPELHAELRKGHTKKDDVCLVTRGNIGQVAYVTDDFVAANMNAQLVRLNGRDAIDGKFLYFALAHPAAQKQFESLKTGTALQQLPIGKLTFMRIPIPPKEEQVEIGNYLWLVNQKLDLIQRKHAALSALFRTLLRELMTARIRVHNLDLPEVESAVTK
jgi:type I restriction enzyme, S subunit